MQFGSEGGGEKEVYEGRKGSKGEGERGREGKNKDHLIPKS